MIDLPRTSHRFDFFPAVQVTSVSSGENSACQVDDCERMIENLTEQNKKLLDEGLMLRSFLLWFWHTVNLLWIFLTASVWQEEHRQYHSSIKGIVREISSFSCAQV